MDRRLGKRSLHSGAAGMSLLEVMIAAAILSVIVIGVFSAIFTSTRQSEFSKEMEIAQFDLERVMEDILSEAFDSTITVYPAGLSIVKGTSVTRINGLPRQYNDLVLPNEGIAVSYVMPATQQDPLEIRLTVSWRNRDGRTQTYNLATLKAR
jgi:prepilin-type N-terminal cleavage/methylation domain-containing protein